MKSQARRRWLTQALTAALVPAVTLRAARAQTPREIELVARRFQFTPADVPLKVGEKVVLLLRATDYAHGFSVPDLGLRADFVPGLVVRVEIQPKKPGTLDFLCDNFCGDDHEDMHGRFTVSP